MHISQELLKKYLTYNPDTGQFSWKDSFSGRGKKKDSVGWTCPKRNYIVICVRGKSYYAHQLAWLYIYGYIPKEIDHINHVKSDNRIKNLREVERVVNARNTALFKTNKSGVAGVCYKKYRRKFEAFIHDGTGKAIFLGMFWQKIDAVIARRKAELLLNYDLSNNNSSAKSYLEKKGIQL